MAYIQVFSAILLFFNPSDTVVELKEPQGSTSVLGRPEKCSFMLGHLSHDAVDGLLLP
jgi:hypothetical protein